MQVSIRGERAKLGVRLQEYIARRLHFALGRFGPVNIMLPVEPLSDLGITKMQSSRWQAEAPQET